MTRKIEFPVLSMEQIVEMARPKPPAKCGVYFLIDHEGQIVYVGQSAQIEVRIAAHAKTQGEAFTTFAYIECSAKLLDVVEAWYIATFEPKLNKPKVWASSAGSLGTDADDVPRST